MTREGFSIAMVFVLVSSMFLSTTVLMPSKNSTQILEKNSGEIATNSFYDTELSKLNLSITMNESEASVDGILLIDYYNAENIAFDEIPFHLYPSGMRYETQPGSITIHSITSRGTSPNVTDIDVRASQQLAWIELESPLAPGEFLSMNISFTTILPDGIDRSGVSGTDIGQDRIYTFTGFYPMPCVYDVYDGWNTDPYIDAGDPFYFDMAYFDLHIDVPQEMTVAATGVPIEVIGQDGRTIYHYEIDQPVREVTFSASRYYQIESTVFNGVNITTYYLPASTSIWETVAIEETTQALELFNSTFGAYPYPSLNVVEQHAYYGGMEYPCQVYVTRIIAEQIQEGTRVPWYHELVIVHEVAHQWWSQLVGDDCVDWGFLDEGLTSWSHSYYAEQYYSDWEYFQATTYLESVRTFYASYQSGSIINRSNTVRPELTSFVDYIQTPLILEKLRRTIGEEAFLGSLRHFFDGYSFGIATLNDLQESFESVYGSDLDWFFLPWFSNGLLPDYAIDDAVFNTQESTLTIRIIDLNEESNDHAYRQEIPIKILDDSDNVVVDTVVWVNGTTDCSFPLVNNPSEIQLDYSGYILVQLPDAETTSYVYRNVRLDFGVDLVFLTITAVVVVIVIVVPLRALRQRKII
ncbi:MAG: M1 family metallopeptidase [Candidatus Thorarchaeota archaeon]